MDMRSSFVSADLCKRFTEVLSNTCPGSNWPVHITRARDPSLDNLRAQLRSCRHAEAGQALGVLPSRVRQALVLVLCAYATMRLHAKPRRCSNFSVALMVGSSIRCKAATRLASCRHQPKHVNFTETRAR